MKVDEKDWLLKEVNWVKSGTIATLSLWTGAMVTSNTFLVLNAKIGNFLVTQSLLFVIFDKWTFLTSEGLLENLRFVIVLIIVRIFLFSSCSLFQILFLIFFLNYFPSPWSNYKWNFFSILQCILHTQPTSIFADLEYNFVIFMKIRKLLLLLTHLLFTRPGYWLRFFFWRIGPNVTIHRSSSCIKFMVTFNL